MRKKKDTNNKILEILEKQKKPIEVSFLTQKIGVNKTTVYRNIDKLIKNNLVCEVEFGDGKKRYELKSLGHHHHIVCKNCGDLKDIELDENKFIENVKKSSNYLVDSHNIEFFGICKNCQ